MNIFVYMLRCRDGSHYVGITRHGLDKRLAEHQTGFYRGYTYSPRPVELVWSADFVWLKDASHVNARSRDGGEQRKKRSFAATTRH